MNYLSYYFVYIYQVFNYFSLLTTKQGTTLNANFLLQKVKADTMEKKAQIIVRPIRQFYIYRSVKNRKQ